MDKFKLKVILKLFCFRLQQRQQTGNPASANQSQSSSGDLRLEIPGIGIVSHPANARGVGALRAGHLGRGHVSGGTQGDVGGIVISGTSYNTPTGG